MAERSGADYSMLDVPEVLGILFYPRPDFGSAEGSGQAVDLMIPVGERVEIGARFHPVGLQAANLLFFHGNGEIVADYDDMAPLYNGLGINFLPVDYRGYGRSSGRPTVTSMMRDAHAIYEYVRTWLPAQGYAGPFVVMGRSLGSASALELAGSYADEIDGLIIESGFASFKPLLELIGASVRAGGAGSGPPQSMDKIAAYTGPTLVIHAQFDHIIPFESGQALYEAAGSTDKTFLMIPGADHNDLFFQGMRPYLAAVKDLVSRAGDKA
jgi:hypothetical protein